MQRPCVGVYCSVFKQHADSCSQCIITLPDMFLELTLINNNNKLMYPGLYMGCNDDHSEILHNKKYNLYQGMKTHMHINLSRIYSWFRLLCESLWTCAWGLMYRVIVIIQTRDTGHFLLQAKWQLKMMSQNCLQFIFAKSSGLLKSHLSNQVSSFCLFFDDLS